MQSHRSASQARGLREEARMGLEPLLSSATITTILGHFISLKGDPVPCAAAPH